MSATTPTKRGGGWVVGQFIILAGILAVGYAPVGHFTPSSLTTVLGIGLALVSAVFGWRAFSDLGKNLTAFPKPLDDATLVTDGVYAIVRHPIYTAVLAGALGYSIYQASLYALAGTVVLGIWFEYKSRREETFLRERFAAYATYAQRVKKFIPFVY